MTTTTIRNVVFDVGGVLIELRYGRFIEHLAAAGIDMTDLPAWLMRVDIAGHERGEFPGETLLERIAAMAVTPMDSVELRTRWLDMFEPAQAMINLARGLMPEYRVYLLSNAGDLYWQHLDGLYGLDSLVHGALASFRAGAVKPSAAIYRKAEALFGLEPTATVFIDDLPQNVEGARQCGWHAIRHVGATQTLAELSALGVRIPTDLTDAA
jgi:2-haloacid dehalogenase